MDWIPSSCIWAMVACGIPIWSGLSKKAVVCAAVSTMMLKLKLFYMMCWASSLFLGGFLNLF